MSRISYEKVKIRFLNEFLLCNETTPGIANTNTTMKYKIMKMKHSLVSGWLLVIALFGLSLADGYSLGTGGELLTSEVLASPNGDFTLNLQGDGNLVLRDAASQALWASGTAGDEGVRLTLQGDGNLVLYRSDGSASWASGTVGSGADLLEVTDLGELRLTAAGTTVWSRNTPATPPPGGPVSYTTVGGLNETTSDITVSSPGNAGDYQIVGIGGSSTQGGTDQPIDRSLMENQGFTLVKVRGDGDKRSEIWFREHNGTAAHDSVTITENAHVDGNKDIGWSITTIDGASITLDPSTFTTASDYSGGHGSTSVPFTKPSGNGMTFVAFFFDDSVQVTDSRGGDILYTVWGQGDGDGFATVLYQPGALVPSDVGVITHDSGGRQWVTASFNATVESDGNPGDGGGPAAGGIGFGDTWRYRDDGSNQGTAWRSVAFDDSGWSSGPGQLGYGDGDEATVLGVNQITYYFRNTFSVSDPSAVTALDASLLYDDGAIVYINGVEVHRTGTMPTGAVDYLTTSALGPDNNQDTFSLNPLILVSGENTVAVEVHNQDSTSSDISFDFELNVTTGSGGGTGPVQSTVEFREGEPITIDGAPTGTTYSGTSDTRLRSTNGSTNYGNSTTDHEVDAESAKHTVIKFEDLFSTIPAGATIDSATLRVDSSNGGNTMSVYRLAEGATWDEATATWNNFGSTSSDGVTLADTTGSAQSVSGAVGVQEIDVTLDVRAWQMGIVNNGWAFLPGGTNGVDFGTSENATASRRPSLTVTYTTGSGGGGGTPVDVSFFNFGGTWRYLDNGSDQGTGWRGASFNDGSWPGGAGQFGYGDGDEVTTLQSSRITYYFRRTFSVVDPADLTALNVDLLYDDGAIVYINGNEVHRTSRMPSGSVNYLTTTTQASPDNSQESFSVNPASAGLVAGENTIAVEVHNRSSGSSDISFDLQLGGTMLQDGLTQLANGVPETVSGGAGEEQAFFIPVPDGVGAVTVTLSGGTGNADVVGRFGQPPSGGDDDVISSNPGNEESISWTNPAGGNYYITVRGVTFFSGAVLTVSYKAPSSTARYRVVWVNDPSTTATVGWDQTGSGNPVVYYGPVDHGADWQSYPSQKGPDRTTSFRGMNNHFARLSGLLPDTAYYFVIKDDQGVSPRFWFKTAPDTPEHFTYVVGGDSRNNRIPRQNANKMVAALRPLFVAFTGDMINTDNNSEWIEWFNDWQLIVTTDGRISPILPHRGNHETGGNSTIYNLFDTTPDNYYAVSFGGDLLRYYVLNSEMTEGGTQGSWLASDLQANHQTVQHLCAGYHKPMRPHTSGKSEGSGEYSAWAQVFFDYGMDFVSESDSHMIKRTYPVRPFTGGGSDEGFIRDDVNGTIYSGEGCWGAPLRTPDDGKAWTLDMASFNGFDLVHVFTDRMEVYTVRVDSAGQVTPLEEGEQIALPAGINLWEPAGGIRLIAGRRDGQVPDSYAQYQLDRWGNQPPAASLPKAGSNFRNFAFAIEDNQSVPIAFEVSDTARKVVFDRAAESGATFRYRGSYDLEEWFDLNEGTDFQIDTVPGDGNIETVELELLRSLIENRDSVFINVEPLTN